MITKSADIWVAWAIRNKRSIYFYDNRVLDLTEFAWLHPGGKKSLENFKYKDITNTLFKVFSHERQPTLQKLSRYVIGTVEQQMVRHQQQKTSLSKSKAQGQVSKKKVCFQRKAANSFIQYQYTEDQKFLQKQSLGLVHSQKAQYNQKISNSSSENKMVTNTAEISIELNLSESEDPQNQNTAMSQGLVWENQHWFDMSFDMEQMQQNKKEINFPYLLTKEKAIL